ncbi:hypothetical protein CDAR_561901 [Caerostris darwini]|uniref:Uncharacterized protein n=1 Tax=Caerostris darwini TaxID=1538125 RepID=A0AAV4PEM9_9ARAC|nr:hypothetical protein CDAR_561901 [Caerostris darwini]
MYNELLRENTTYFKKAIIKAAKQPSYEEAIRNNQSTIIITPKEREQPINEIRTNIQKELKGSTEISNIKKVLISKNNQIIIKTTNTDQATKLKNSIHQNQHLAKIINARTPQKKKLKVIIYGILEDSSEQDIIKSIEIALDKESQNTKLVKTSIDKNERRHAIVILQSQDAKKLITIGRVFINLLSSTV